MKNLNHFLMDIDEADSKKQTEDIGSKLLVNIWNQILNQLDWLILMKMVLAHILLLFRGAKDCHRLIITI